MKAVITKATEAAAVAIVGIPRRYRRTQECFVVLCLDGARQVIGKPVLVAVGSATYVQVEPRDVFREAIRRNASSVIVAHQHPSGVVVASSDDRAMHERLKQVGELLGIPLLDSLVLHPTEPAEVVSIVAQVPR